MICQGVDAYLRSGDEVHQLASLLQGHGAHLLEGVVDVCRLHGEGTAELADLLYPLLLLHPPLVALLCGKAYVVTALGEACIGIVLAKQYSVLGTRGEHAVGLVHALRDKVVNEHAYVGLVAMQDELLLALEFQCRIDAGNKSLSCRLLVAGGAVDLSGKVEVLHHL